MQVISFFEYKDMMDLALEMTRRLQDGAVLVVPTDTVYGLIADAGNKKALQKIFDIKKRSLEKPLPVFVKNISHLKDISWLSTKSERFLEKMWPGALTAVLSLKTSQSQSEYISRDGTIAVRIPDHHFIKLLLNMLGKPIAATSANISGEGENLCSIEHIVATFKKSQHQPDIIVAAGNLVPAQSSTIVDLTAQGLKVLRTGDISVERLEEVFGAV